MNLIRRKAVSGLIDGDTFEIKRTFSMAEISQFESLSKDHNPVHSDVTYAKIKGFNDVIAHGLLTASLITEIGGQLGWLATSMSFEFKRPVYAGEELTCTWTIGRIERDRRANAEITVINGSSQVVLLAKTTGILPNERERAIMASTGSGQDQII